MSPLSRLEDSLAEVYKSSPPLSPSSKRSIVGIWPSLALVFGILQIIAAWGLWHWGHTVAAIPGYGNAVPGSYINTVPPHLNIFYWVALVLLVLDGILLLWAYQGLKARTKNGWNLIFYSALLNIPYGLATALDSHGSVGTFLLNIVFSAVVLYFIFQIRDQYSLIRSKSKVRTTRRS